MKSNRIIPLLLLLFMTSCSANVQEGSAATPTPLVVTQTLPPSATSAPTYTPLPPPPTPTTAPVEGTATTQINVRSQPSTAGQVLGIVAPYAKLQVIGKDPGGNWYQILYPSAADGKGWVTAQYVSIASNAVVPVIGGGGANQNSTSGNVAIIQQKLNVRSGPGTDFNSLGTLNPQDVVNLIGKDSNGAWLQVEFAAGPDGKGWINAAFAQSKGVENLPIVTESGQMVGTGTPTGIPPTPTATVIPARNDDDSQSSPIVQMSFDADTKRMIYSGDVSSPEGDAEDWISFTSLTPTLLVELECSGSAAVKADLLEDASVTMSCGEPAKVIHIQAKKSYLLHIQSEPFSSGMHYSNYTVTIAVIP